MQQHSVNKILGSPGKKQHQFGTNKAVKILCKQSQPKVIKKPYNTGQ